VSLIRSPISETPGTPRFWSIKQTLLPAGELVVLQINFYFKMSSLTLEISKICSMNDRSIAQGQW
jgi:hypothetical protein